MAENKKDDVVAPVASTQYVVEHAPKLPSADVAVSASEPMIDKRLVEARNREAKAMADRFNK